MLILFLAYISCRVTHNTTMAQTAASQAHNRILRRSPPWGATTNTHPVESVQTAATPPPLRRRNASIHSLHTAREKDERRVRQGGVCGEKKGARHMMVPRNLADPPPRKGNQRTWARQRARPIRRTVKKRPAHSAPVVILNNPPEEECALPLYTPELAERVRADFPVLRLSDVDRARPVLIVGKGLSLTHRIRRRGTELVVACNEAATVCDDLDFIVVVDTWRIHRVADETMRRCAAGGGVVFGMFAPFYERTVLPDGVRRFMAPHPACVRGGDDPWPTRRWTELRDAVGDACTPQNNCGSLAAQVFLLAGCRTFRTVGIGGPGGYGPLLLGAVPSLTADTPPEVHTTPRHDDFGLVFRTMAQHLLAPSDASAAVLVERA